ncbi:hypothetical protein JHK85_004755 [Glycine max]|uniref:Uncharacterized protein n=1 Tax=Glycine soja TaxID=3848 RepID=A0A0B2RKX6_GLYSO|nr:hypothetical protein JHK85_004755 [Glycine max]KAG5080517.1 hypothetical protein JHK86_004582 [Glycine max]KAH1060895.1 hypothetical protein GYH30_004394 [Glycine max]KHN35216.1 hypothetical protein glysoja_041333 [Glycine soja]
MKPLPSSTPIATSGTPSAMATSRPPTGRRLSTPSPLTAPMPPLPKSPSSDTVYRNDFSGFIAFVVASGFRIQIPTRLAATQPGSATSKNREWERDPVGEVVAGIKVLGDGFVRMEQTKMEMAKEIETMWMEMEMNHTKMILESQ